jgi:TRAP-type mannitol/chloroaromatic compound transport system substrate-binding protein
MGAMEVYKKKGNVIIELAPEVQGMAYKLGREWAEAQAAKDPWFKKFYDSQKKFEESWKGVEKNRILTYA